ncbi:MAG: YggS family pyridoxal phosphate-dependent enzyme [Lactobacillales bacterium]|nr:YggS family pyridoxal phosphate-dependent enzyme [Lactobacillales bacterium]
MNLQGNLNSVREKIAQSAIHSGRKIEDVHMIAVTKYFDVGINQHLYDLGVSEFAENRVDKFILKATILAQYEDIIWHFIGNLQRRKVKKVINHIDYFHALDSFALAQEIEKYACELKKCFVEVNVSGEESKHGFSVEEVEPFLRDLCLLTKIQVVGLMTMAPFAATSEELHEYFGKLKNLQEEMSKLNLPYAPCTQTSMGMSSDFEIAIEQGASYIRIGSALYE